MYTHEQRVAALRRARGRSVSQLDPRPVTHKRRSPCLTCGNRTNRIDQPCGRCRRFDRAEGFACRGGCGRSIPRQSFGTLGRTAKRGTSLAGQRRTCDDCEAKTAASAGQRHRLAQASYRERHIDAVRSRDRLRKAAPLNWYEASDRSDAFGLFAGTWQTAYAVERQADGDWLVSRELEPVASLPTRETAQRTAELLYRPDLLQPQKLRDWIKTPSIEL